MKTLTKKDISRTILILIAAFLAYGLVAGLRASSGVFVSQIADITGISYGTISFVATIRNIIYAIACPVFGFLTLRKSYTFIIILGLILTAIGFAGVILFPGYAGLIIFQGFFFGIGAGALCYSITYAAAARFLKPKTAILFAGILSMSQGIFKMILAPAVRFSSEFEGGFIICIASIAIALVAIFPLTFVFKTHEKQHTDTADDTPSIKKILKIMAKSPVFYLIAISYFIYGLCQGEMMNHLVKRASVIMEMDANGTMAVEIFYGFALIIGPLLAGIIASKVKNKRFALATMFLTWAIIAFITFIIIPPKSIATVVLIVILGIVISMAVPYHAILTREHISMNYFAAAFAIITMFEVFGYAANAYFGGRCFDLTGSFIGFNLVIVGLAATIGIIFAIDGIRKRKQLKSIT